MKSQSKRTDYPVDIGDLVIMLGAAWPETCESVLSREVVQMDVKAIGDNTAVGGVIVTATHRVMRSSGPDVGSLNDSQLFFTEEEAIRALWFHVNKSTPPVDFITDEKGVLFIWRDKPEINWQNGICQARMRYSVIYKTRDGDYVAR